MDEKISKNILAVWFLGEFGRYIPGNIWSFAGRFYLGVKKGIGKKSLAQSMVWEVILLISSSAILSVPLILKTFSWQRILLTILFLGLIVSIGYAIIQLKFRNERYNFFRGVSKSFGQILLKSGIFQILAWVSFSLGTLIIISQFKLINIINLFPIPIFSWLIGYLSIVTPMGLGVREGVLAFLLSPYLGLVNSSVVALLSRIVLVLVELINVMIWLYLEKGSNLRKDESNH